MKRLFEFEPYECKLKVKLAFSYTPKILQNHFDTRPYSGLLYVEQGTYTYTFESGCFCARPGSLIYLPPRSIAYSYQIDAIGDQEPKTMQIEFDLCDNYGVPIAYSDCPRLLSNDAELVHTEFLSAISAYVDKSPLRLQAGMLNLLASCSELVDVKNERSLQKRLAPAVAALQENYNKPIAVSELATLCHMSESQLRRLFHRLTGKSPIAYKNELVLDAAKRLLKYGELGIGEIADTLGFYDIYAFSHFFSCATDSSPSEYRKSRRI